MVVQGATDESIILRMPNTIEHACLVSKASGQEASELAVGIAGLLRQVQVGQAQASLT
jgi:hypothetical protein